MPSCFRAQYLCVLWLSCANPAGGRYGDRLSGTPTEDSSQRNAADLLCLTPVLPPCHCSILSRDGTCRGGDPLTRGVVEDERVGAAYRIRRTLPVSGRPMIARRALIGESLSPCKQLSGNATPSEVIPALRSHYSFHG